MGGDKELYIQLSNEENDLPLFHKSWWLDAICREWDAAVVKNGNNVAGVWPYPLEHKIGITISRNPALTPYLGPHVLFPADLKESKRDNFEHEIISELIKRMPPMKVWNAACRPGLKQIGLFKDSGFRYDFRQTFIMGLEAPEEEILGRLHEDFRRSIRKAGAEMTITNEPEALPILYEYQTATLTRKDVRMSYPLRDMERVFNRCMEHGACALWVARKQGVVQAILWNMWDKTRGYYLVGSKNPEINDNHGMTALIWQSIKHSKALGKISFDYEGSMVPGVERFFRRFGAERVLYPVLLKNDSLIWRVLKAIRK